jgi:hypothetical protein
VLPCRPLAVLPGTGGRTFLSAAIERSGFSPEGTLDISPAVSLLGKLSPFTDFKTFHVVTVDVEDLLEAMFFLAEGAADLAAEAAEDTRLLEGGEIAADGIGQVFVAAEIDRTLDAVFTKVDFVVWSGERAGVFSPRGNDGALGGEESCRGTELGRDSVKVGGHFWAANVDFSGVGGGA